MKAEHRHISDAAIPVCAVKLTKTGGVALEVPLGPTHKNQGLSPFTGWGMEPLITNSEEIEPESETIQKEMIRFLRLNKGHNNLSKVWNFYKPRNANSWPSTERRELQADELWPTHQEVHGGILKGSPCKKMPRRVSGAKYSTTQSNGYTQSCLSTALKGKYKEALVHTANI